MLDRDRLFFIAVAGILIAGLFFAALLNREQRDQKHYKAAQEVYEQSKAEAPPGAIPERGITNPTAYREEWRDENDLRAQRDMAKYARWLFAATAVSVVISLFAIFLISETLVATRDTLVEAKKTTKLAELTLRQSEGATKAAFQTAAVAQETGRAQAAAFVTIAKIMLRMDDSRDWPPETPHIRMDMHYKVSGPTPAFNIKFATLHRLCEGLELPTDLHKEIRLVSHEQPPLSEGKTRRLTMLSWTRGPKFEEYRIRGKTVYVAGVVTWRDVFGQRRAYLFSFHFLTPVPRKKARKMYIAFFGNRLADAEEVKRYN
jgi:hypothetical protein